MSFLAYGPLYCTCETWVTLASILLHQVNTGRVVLTLVIQAIINVHLTPVTIKPSWTVAAVEAKNMGQSDEVSWSVQLKPFYCNLFYHGTNVLIPVYIMYF